MGKIKHKLMKYALPKSIVFCLFLGIISFGFVFSHSANADTPKLVIPSTGSDAKLSGCATDTWTAMVNQAVLESRRKTAMDKSFIVKSDSVLQYSCFGEILTKTVGDKKTGSKGIIDPIFTASDYWENKEVDILGDEKLIIEIYNQDGETEPGYLIDFMSKNSLEESLVLVVDGAFKNYINSQFNHPYLSGTVPVGGTGLEPCANMSQIWKAAMCKNLDATIPFPTFEEIIAKGDPRQFPPGANWECK